MHRYFVKCAYDGTEYSGWQIQNNAKTVQGTIEDALKVVLRLPISIVGCGRTDAGVHASQYYFHFDFEEDISPKLAYSINKVLPKDIQLQKFLKVDHNRHARFDAIARRYRYQISLDDNPFNRYYHYQLKRANQYDINKLKSISSIFVGKHDFEFLSKTGSDVNNYICTIKHSEWAISSDEWIYTIEANRFMRGMVRLLVGTQLLYASGILTEIDIYKALKKSARLPRSYSVPGHSLFLEKIDYPFISG